ncbi:MAG: dihydrodipicolinate synthase family protein [Chelatococcus sp.]|uniref:dihydrodipicolinate synthase family protein n=1 Tax=Chelatococcus sp. TaxID=1953771 RepID=UPI0025C303E1|nr:dihydrodipicolinate synthase family protein [Chelatococcus sp.]MBX3539753.1 dihydrodipicolinate synthase family protein [Chelatococcus sp.]
MVTPLRGNWATLLLPISDDDSIDFSRLRAEIDVLIDAQVDGIYSNGTAGEFHNQTEAEYDRVQETLATACLSAGMPFVVGACHSDPMVSRQRVARAVSLEPRAIQVILPDWWPLTDAEAVDYLALIAEEARGVPLVLYNPPHAKRVLTPPELRWVLSRAPTVEAVKLGDGDAAWYASAREHLGGISLFVPGHHLATGMREGVAAGAFSNVACLNPRGAQRWTDLMATDIASCLDLEARLQAFIDTHVWPFRRDHGYSNAALDKLLADIGDWAPVGTRLRRPYRFIDAGEARRLRPIARQAVPELFI